MGTSRERGASAVALQDAVSAVCGALGIDVTCESGERLATYAQELCRWNRRINLTGASDPISFVRGPLFDAMTLVPVMKKTASFVDVGSGGGLPGIPAMILTGQSNVTLVEPRAKRATFLRHALSVLGLEAAVHAVRMEALPLGEWHGAAAQAVFEPVEWMRRAVSLLTPDGVVYVLSAVPLSSPLPGALSIEARFECRNPVSGVERYAYRLHL